MNKKKKLKKKKKLQVFKIGSSPQDLRMQFNNFYNRWVQLKLIKSPKMQECVIKHKLYRELKIEENLSGLTIKQMQYRVTRLKKMLDSERKKR